MSISKEKIIRNFELGLKDIKGEIPDGALEFHSSLMGWVISRGVSEPHEIEYREVVPKPKPPRPLSEAEQVCVKLSKRVSYIDVTHAWSDVILEAVEIGKRIAAQRKEQQS